MKNNYPLAALKRDTFGKLVHLLFMLKVTNRVHVPVTSNAYHTEDIRNLLKGYTITSYDIT